MAINGGRVEVEGAGFCLRLPVTSAGYADAQIDDYGCFSHRKQYRWSVGAILTLKACFSHPVGVLQGTAGFGFWNAPFGDPTIRWPALPQAVWFFYASEPNDLPLASSGAGRGWFVSTLDATTVSALMLAPLSPIILFLSQFPKIRQRIWTAVRPHLSISYAPIPHDMCQWHTYELRWLPQGTTFLVDGELLLHTPFSPHGPLGFVCWLDNQYMVAGINGRFRGGTIPIRTEQWLHVHDLAVRSPSSD